MRWSKLLGVCAASALLSCGFLVAGTARAQKSPFVTHSAPLHRLASGSLSPGTSLTSAALPGRIPEFFVMIDPSHGGDDKGAVLAGKLMEKYVTLSWARDLKRQIEERGIPARLLRESDQTISLDRRAELTNEARPVLYVALHAGPPYRGVRVYMPALLFAPPPAKGRLVSWEAAQMASVDRSRSAARIVALELRKQGRRVRVLAAPLRPLNNLVTPAIAVELSSSSKPFEGQKQQNALASAIAAGIAQACSHMGARP